MARKKIFKDNTVVIKMAAHNQPEASYVHGKDYVYWGKRNEYFDFLKDIYYKASKHAAIINGKARYICGNGWEGGGETIINSDGENLNHVTKKVVFDYLVYGGYALEVIWNNGKTGAEFRHVPFNAIRTNEDQSQYYFTKDWTRKTDKGFYPVIDPTKNEDYKVYEPFNPDERQGESLLYFKRYSPGLELYPMPEYEAALLYIELEYQIANYWYNRVKSGFMPSAIINFYNGEPSEDEKRKLEESIGAKFGGTDNSGRFILNFAPNKDSAADVSQLNPPELGAQYETLNEQMQQEVLTGHGVTSPMLFGIKTPGQLGGRSEMIEANELFQNSYATPQQQVIEEFFSQYVFPYVKGLKGDMKLKKQEPIGYMFSESTMIKYLPSKAISEMVAMKMGIDLSKYPEHEKEQKEKREEEKNKQEFKKKRINKALEYFKSTAKKRDGQIIYSRPVTKEMMVNLSKSEEELTLMKFDKAPDIPIVISGPIKDLTPKGGKPADATVFVDYTYEYKPEFQGVDPETSREFCQEMMSMVQRGESWTREEIDGLDNGTNDPEVDDVWESRGGWYNDNGVPVPQCRHEWVQRVRIKN